MRAVVYRETGPSSVLQLVDREVPEPGHGEVRVRLVRSGVNPTDWKFRAGGMGELAFREVVPGQDGSGVVDAVGPDVDGLAVGDRVWTMLAQHRRPGGTAQELVVLPVGHLTTLPEGASYDAGAVTMATDGWFLAAARTIEGPPMSICSMTSSGLAPEATVSRKG